MADIKEIYQTADWKKEKHVPSILAPDKAAKGERIKVSAVVGREIAHPNTTTHHIRWIALSFLPAGEKLACDLGRAEFNAHGESTKGPDTSTVYTEPSITVEFKTEKSGTIVASSYCNIHGFWSMSKDIEVE